MDAPMGLWEVSLSDFLIVSIFLGGGAAWLTGRATALTWSPWWVLAVYVVLLMIATRFIHYSLFGGSFFLPLETLPRALYRGGIDLVILGVAAALGRQVTRARQMSTQYQFIYDRSGPIGWRERA
jgi:hypothetical protein